MVEAVFRSRDCLRDNFRSPAFVCHSRRSNHGGENHILNPNSSRSLQKISGLNRFSRSEGEGRVMVVKEQSQDLTKQVRILKRGEVVPSAFVKGKMETKDEVFVDAVPRTPVAAKTKSKDDISEVMVLVDPSRKAKFFAGEDEIPRTPVAAKMLSKQVAAKMRSNKGVKEAMIDGMCKRVDFLKSIGPEQEVFRKMVETKTKLLAGEDGIPRMPVAAKMLSMQFAKKMSSKQVVAKTRLNKSVKEVVIDEIEPKVSRKIVETLPKLFAGTMFMSSPCPSSLPKPSFSFLKKDGRPDCDSATKTMLCRLNLEVA